MDKTAAIFFANTDTAAPRAPRNGSSSKTSDSLFADMVNKDDRRAPEAPADKAEQPARVKRTAKKEKPEAKADAQIKEDPKKVETKPAKKADTIDGARPVCKIEETDKVAAAPVDALIVDPALAVADVTIAADLPVAALSDDAAAIQSAAITIEDLLADIAAAIPVTVVAEQPVQPAGDGDGAVMPEPDMAAAKALPVTAAPEIPTDTAQADAAKALPADLPADLKPFKDLIKDKLDQAKPAEVAASVEVTAEKPAVKLEAAAAPAVETAPKAAVKAAAPREELAPVVPAVAEAVKTATPVAAPIVATHLQAASKPAEQAKAEPISITPLQAGEAGKTASYSQTAQLVKAQTVNQPAIVEQVAVKLNHAAKNGDRGFNIQLHPAELGRIEVKLDVTANGQARATVTADNSATLDLMRQDRGSLERALSDAGLKLDSGSLNFNLREGGQQQGAFEQAARQSQGGNAVTRAAKVEEEVPAQVINLAVGINLANGRVDIRA